MIEPNRPDREASRDVLTYRTGAAGAPSAARFMSEHLLQQTLPPEMAAMAEYYEQGVTPPTMADAVAARYGRLLVPGHLLAGDHLDEVVRIELARLSESMLGAGGPGSDAQDLTMRTLGALIAAGLVDPTEALSCAQRSGVAIEMSNLEQAVETARINKDYSSATAAPRRDINPALALRLGIDPHRGLTQSQVAFLLNGQRADGKLIEGQTKRAASQAIARIFALDPRLRPDRTQLEHMLAGRTARGDPLAAKEAERAVRRLQSALGVKTKAPTQTERDNILAGLAADGTALTDRQYRAILETSKARIGYIDLTFSAPKSASIAWAFAPTNAERAIIHQAHRDAIDSVMRVVEAEIGRASKGSSAKDGYDAGSIGWVSFDHYAARPTVEVIRTDEQGGQATELHSLVRSEGRLPGDMQVHTHVAVLNAVETPSGRLGGLDLAQLQGRIHEWGALYQAYLAANLRDHGVKVELDRRTEMARLSAVPESVVSHFSKRTLTGTDAARAYAKSLGLDWDSLDPDRQIGLLKSGVQNPREAKSDDVSDLTAWRCAARELGYAHRSILRPNDIAPEVTRAERLETAFQAAMPLLGKQFERRAVIDGADVRIAAAKGLIAGGIRSPDDVGAITQAFRERGVQRRGEDAGLVWANVAGKQGRARIAITTTLVEREEKLLVATARTGSRDKSSALTQAKIAVAVTACPDIDFSSSHGRAQRKVIDQLGTGGRISMAIGVAGSGKTTLLRPLVRAWQDDGRMVYGIALAWRQSDDLAAAGIDVSRTRAVASFLRAAQSGAIRLDRQSVIVVDEVGLLGTRQLNDILAFQKKTGFQLVMLGDPRQMQSVEAGPVIELLRRARGQDTVPELRNSVRQIDAEERETALMFRNGQTAEALQRKAANGTLHIAPGGYREALLHIADLWQERVTANRDRPGFSISVSAPTNAEAHDISLAIRDRRRTLGEVGQDQIKLQATDGEGVRVYDLALAPGDRVRLFSRVNAKFFESGTVGNIGRNGTVLEIAEIQDDGLTLRASSGKLGFVAWDTLRDEANGHVKLAYGDALTTNTAQGTTVTEHIHALPSGSRLVTAFGAYTSGSRHREQSFIVTSEGAERAEIIGRRPLGDRREIMPSDVLNNIVRNASRQPEKESALAMIERAANLRRGTIGAAQKAHHGMEARAAAHLNPTTLRDRFANRRINKALEDRLPGLLTRLRRNGAAMGRIAQAGMALVERVAEIAQHRRVKRPAETAYWETLAQKGAPPAEATETLKQTNTKGRRI
jgi:molybdopterin-guanine dinucleotide biosynthesis protein